MNSNRHSVDGTSSALDDSSLERIKSGMGRANERRASKTQATKKTAAKVQPEIKEQSHMTQQSMRIASINDVPKDFERIGTGFFRQGHHLWEMSPSEDGGFVLVRKGGEDHVLGYDPEPLERNAAIITDRFGKEIKTGSRVKLPHRGKVAGATVLLLSPQSLGLEMDSGEKVNAAPDMVELLEEMLLSMSESMPLPPPPKPEHHEEHDEEEEEEEEDSKDKGDEEADESDEEKSEGFEPEVEPSSKKANVFSLQSDWYDFWRSAGQRVAQATPPPAKPKSPKLPAAEDPAAKERRRQRRKERRQMMKGLPPGTKIPPRPRQKAAGEHEEDEKEKSYVRVCKQLVDALKYILEDEKYRDQPELLADALEQEIEHFDEEMDSVNREGEEEIKDKLSVETPPKDDKSLDDLRAASRVVVSMTDL